MAAPKQTTIAALLSSIKLSSLKPSPNAPAASGVITIDSRSTVPAAFQRLLSHSILGAPVYDVATRQYTGFFELSDLVPFLVRRYDKAEAIAMVAKKYDDVLMNVASHAAQITNTTHTTAVATTHAGSAGAGVAAGVSAGTASTATGKPATMKAPKPHTPLFKYIDDLFSAEAETAIGSTSSGIATMASVAVAEQKHNAPTVLTLSKRHPLVALSVDHTLWDAAKQLTGSNHRLCVCRTQVLSLPNASAGDAGETETVIERIVTQSTVISVLAQHAAHLVSEFASRLDIGSRPVIGVLESARVIDAFRRMEDCAVPGLAVLDGARTYCDQLQGTHLKLFLNHVFSALNYEAPVTAFLKIVHDCEASHRTAPPMQNATLVMKSFQPPTVGQLIMRLAATRSHCIYVCTPVATIGGGASVVDFKTAAPDTDTRMTPILTVSLGDVLRAICMYGVATTSGSTTAALTAAAKAALEPNDVAIGMQTK